MGSNSQTDGCSFTKNTCTNGESPDEPDMPENYMDYSTETCQNMFTKGQSGIMRAIAVLSRPDLLHVVQNEEINLNIGDYVVINGDTFEISAGFTQTIFAGDSVQFLNMNNGVFYTSNGNFILSTNNNIPLTENKEINTNTSISNLISNKDISIFPNPVSDKLYIKNKNSQKIDVLILSDLSGKIIAKFALENSEISIKNISNGLYFASIYNENKLVSIQKISIQK